MGQTLKHMFPTAVAPGKACDTGFNKGHLVISTVNKGGYPSGTPYARLYLSCLPRGSDRPVLRGSVERCEHRRSVGWLHSGRAHRKLGKKVGCCG